MATEIIDPPPPSSRSTPLVAVAVIGLVLLFLPALAFVVGARAEPIENRPLADFPSPADGWSFFPGMNAWSTDHLPLRKDAVALNDRLVEGLFGAAPVTGGSSGPAVGGSGGAGSLDNLFPRVIEGEDGWLYLGGDMKNPCLAERDVGDTLDELVALRDTVEASGRRFVFVVAPDKSSVLPEHLPDTYPGERCAAERKAAMWQALGAIEGRESWLIDLRDPLLERQAADGVDIYRQNDTHWTPRGGAVFGQELLGLLEPGLTSYADVVQTGTRDRAGDLAALLGRVAIDTYAVWELQRAGVVPPDDFPSPGPRPVRLRTTSADAALFRPPTLLLGDSFTAASRPLVYPLFADLTVLHSQSSASDPSVIGDAVAASEVVVLEVVERDLVSEEVSILAPSLRAAVAVALG